MGGRGAVRMLYLQARLGEYTLLRLPGGRTLACPFVQSIVAPINHHGRF